MLIKTENITTLSHTDKQKDVAYMFDSILENVIKNKKNISPKLYRKLSPNASLQEISDNISDDFGLHSVKIRRSKLINSSYYEMGHIYINDSHKNNLEVLLHEFAHLLSVEFFPAKHSNNHDGHFLAVFRFLLNHYDIVCTEDFNSLALTYFPKLDIYDDFIETFTFMEKKELLTLKEQKKNLHIENNDGVFIYESGFKKDIINTIKSTHIFIVNDIKSIYIYIKLNKIGFDYIHPFFEITREQFKKTILKSPPFLMSDDGLQVTSRNAWGYYGYIEADGSYMDNGLIGFSSKVAFNSDDSDNDAKKLVNRTITQNSKELKKEGFNIIKTTSLKEYHKLYDLMKEAYFNLR